MSNVALTTRDGFANVAVTTRVETPVAPEITTTALPAGTVGAVYDQTIQVTGTAPITCTIQSGALPPELTLNETTRQITGPALATPGLYEFTVRAENAAGFDDQLLSILVPNEGSGGTAPVVTTVTLVPATAEIAAGGATADMIATVEDNNGDPIPNLTGTTGSNATGVATAAQLAPTDAAGQATVRATSGAAGTANITITFDGVVSNAAVITVRAGTEAPTDITLSASSVAENSANGTVIGALAAVDPDQPSGHTFSLTADAGGRFGISGSNLVVANGSLLNREAASSHSITVRATDADGLTFDKAFTITVTNVNEAPTGIALSASSIIEGAANGTIVGSLTRTDPDAGDTGTFSLDDDAGGRFAIVATGATTANLVVADGSLLDYGTAQSHAITARFTDAGGLFTTQAFTISVLEVASGVTSVTVTPAGASIASNQTQQFSAVVAGSPTPSQDVTWSVVAGPGSINGAGLYTPAGAGTPTVRATSVQAPSIFGEATLTVVAVDEEAPAVSVTASALSVTEPGSILLTANATDNIGVAEVRFYRDGAQIGQPLTAAPFQRTLTVGSSADNGTFAFTARAYDAAGNATLSAPLSVTVNVAGAPLARSTGLADMIEIPRKDTTRAIVFQLTDATTGDPLSAVVPTVALSRNGGAPQAATGVVTETQIPGTYVYIPSEADVNVEGDMLILVSATGAAALAPITTRVVTPYGKR